MALRPIVLQPSLFLLRMDFFFDRHKVRQTNGHRLWPKEIGRFAWVHGWSRKELVVHRRLWNSLPFCIQRSVFILFLCKIPHSIDQYLDAWFRCIALYIEALKPPTDPWGFKINTTRFFASVSNSGSSCGIFTYKTYVHPWPVFLWRRSL